jgi:twitching motility protein PilT
MATSALGATTVTHTEIRPNSLSARMRIASELVHVLMFSSSIQDVIIKEDLPIYVKGAMGTVPLKSLKNGMGDLIPNKDDIRSFMLSFIDGMSIKADYGQVWAQDFEPVLKRGESINRLVSTDSGGSFRVNLFIHSGGKLGLVLRLTRKSITPLGNVNIPAQMKKLIEERQSGLLIITGPTGSAKTETAFSILDYFNTRRSGHILTVEDPIERYLSPKNCSITQREVGRDVSSYASGMYDLLRQSPDIVLAGEARDGDTVESAINFGASGKFMMVTTHGDRATTTLRRMLAMTGDRKEGLRELLADTLIGVIQQSLVPNKPREGAQREFVLVSDVLYNTGKVRDWLAQAEGIRHIDGAIASRNLEPEEYHSRNIELAHWVKNGVIDKVDAIRHCHDMQDLVTRINAR